MSILIKGMEMPKEGRLTLQISADGAVYVVNRCNITAETYTTEAALVPPLGRLIDANKIGLTDFEMILCQKENPFKNALEMLLEKIVNAPTIIEAEEGE